MRVTHILNFDLAFFFEADGARGRGSGDGIVEDWRRGSRFDVNSIGWNRWLG